MSMTIMMDFRTWQLSKGLVMLPEIRDVRGAFTRLLHKLRGKERYPSKKKIRLNHILLPNRETSGQKNIT